MTTPRIRRKRIRTDYHRDNRRVVVLNLHKFLEQFHIPVDDRTIKTLSLFFSLLRYLKPDQELETNDGNFVKLDNDLIHMDIKITHPFTIDQLEGAGVIRIPV